MPWVLPRRFFLILNSGGLSIFALSVLRTQSVSDAAKRRQIDVSCLFAVNHTLQLAERGFHVECSRELKQPIKTEANYRIKASTMQQN